MPTSTSEKVRENRLRRVAERQGLALHKNPRRDPRALDYGTWRVVNLRSRTRGREFPGLDAVEAYLLADPSARDADERP